MDHDELSAEAFVKPTDDYLRVMTTTPEVAIADVATNVERLLVVYKTAQTADTELLVTPELSLTGYTAADLFHNQHVLEQTKLGLLELAAATTNGPAMVVGAPLEHQGVLYNCGVMLADGKVAGIVPKSYLPNYKEFYEYRWFSSGRNIVAQTIELGTQNVPFGTDLLFELNDTTVGIEICEDLFAPINPGTRAALAGADVVVNLSASNELVGKTEYRRALVSNFAGRLICGYVYTSSGPGESVADVIYGGHQMIAENGRLSRERTPHNSQVNSLLYDLDRTYLRHDRIVNKTFAEQAQEIQSAQSYRRIAITAPKPSTERLERRVDPYPFVPSNPETLDERCEEIFGNLAQALAQRIRDGGSRSMVIGLSGGLDSTLALLTGLYACDLLSLPYSFIHTVTMPGQASSERTQDNASLLATALGTTHKVIPIKQLANELLSAIGHDQMTEDITFENAQARMRTTILMNYANMMGGFVEGTGDMSENAIGWCTYNGDHMSMFNPNAAVPKTLVSHLVRWYTEQIASDVANPILRDILATPISPELTGTGDLSQTTEDIVGPYALTDFFMYEHLRYGSRPNKIGYLAMQAFEDIYDAGTVTKWLTLFMRRFTSSQWKRDVMPNGTKVGSVSESPRGDLRMAPNTSPNWYK
jgi:NAD+ synthase (glutamine-hydrolysing)